LSSKGYINNQGDIVEKGRNTVLYVILLIAMSIVFLGQRPEPEKTIIKGEPMYGLLEPGDIPAIFNPEFISVTEAKNYYYDEEPLLMVVDGDKSKAYSTWHLDRHEIVNDYINGKAITVTW
jgi:hypothetical protein